MCERTATSQAGATDCPDEEVLILLLLIALLLLLVVVLVLLLLLLVPSSSVATAKATCETGGFCSARFDVQNW